MSSVLTSTYANSQMNLGAPELEYIDPTPDVHALFLHFDLIFFNSSLKSRATVRWSKRMYSCAGICSYEGRAGFCDIAISEPLLKLRTRKDLVETLIHEMIHAYLFITDRDRDRDGHGPNFHFHMNRINKIAGLNISVYHDFHAEVKLYQTHWWRCDGICRNTRPYYGIVRRSSNRAPGPNDNWWDSHKRWCGGTFIKIKQPEPKTKTKKGKLKDDIVKPKTKQTDSITAKTVKTLDNYMIKTASNTSITKDKENNVFKNPKDNVVKSPNSIKTINDYYAKKTAGTDVTITVVTKETKNKESTLNTSSVQDKVRNHWANYPYPSTPNNKSNNRKSISNSNFKLNDNGTTLNAIKTNKHKIDDIDTSQSKRAKKIDDYFKATASSILKDIYGPLKIVEGSNDKLKVVLEPENYVNCPICNVKVISTNINAHVDECLNRDIIEVLQKDNGENLDTNNEFTSKEHTTRNPEYNDIKNIDLTKIKHEIKSEYEDASLINSNFQPKIEIKKEPNSSFEIKTEPGTSYNINSENVTLIQECACCGEMVQKPMQEHLEECLAFFTNNTTEPEEGLNQSTSSVIEIDDEDDQFNESQTLNPTGTKYPCPSCLTMVENDDMNNHLDNCLN